MPNLINTVMCCYFKVNAYMDTLLQYSWPGQMDWL